MSINSSFTPNVSLPPSPLSSSFSIYHQIYSCLNCTVGAFNTTTFTITSILILLPLYIFILYLGLQRWRQHSSQMTSHSDVFTYHMIGIELTSVSGCTLMCCAVHTDVPQMMMVGIYLFSINSVGQMIFHMLTCVERYLAVVHPITYLNLKKTNGITVRNVAIGCAWLLSFAGTSLMSIEGQVFTVTLMMCIIVFLLAVISFCSLSVLCVLIRPGPGEGGGARQQLDQSKLKAFYTIMAILGVLLFRFGGNIVTIALYASPHLGETGRCALWLSIFWLGLPGSLVLPLLFLQRAEKLPCCKNNNKSGQGPKK